MIRAIRPFEIQEPTTPDETAGFGALRTERGCLPLKSLEVRARICGLHAQTVVRQTFHNSTAEAIEATYIFPLPDRAAVTSFTMRVAGRVVEGLLRERQDARQEYDRAIAAGYRASIAEEERSGTFSLRVGNLPPGDEVAVELTLVGPLTVAHGEAEYRFPLVVAPRYVPGVPLDGASVGLGVVADTDQVPDASRVTPPVMLPGFPNPVRLSLEVTFEPASLLATVDELTQSLTASLHGVVVDEVEGLTVRLQPGERLNRDFILRLAVAASSVQSMLAYTPAEAERRGTFSLTLVPPAEVAERPPQPRDVVFVIDRSGSMEGWKMVAARRAIGRLLDTLLEHDRFSVLAFDDTVEFSPETPRQLTAAVNRARWRTIEWLAKVDARGGTELAGALDEAVALVRASGADREPIIILVTDGQVAGEDALLNTLSAAAHGRPPRIYAVGIDQAVNAGFLRRLADLSRGGCELVESEGRLDEVMEHLHRLTSSPVVCDLRLEPIGWQWQADSLAPARLPDVFLDRPITIFSRHNLPEGELRLRVTGKDALGQPWQQEVVGQATSGGLLTSLWGRARVRELEDAYASQSAAGGQQLSQQIVAVSLEAHVLSRFTAYVAIDRSATVNRKGKPREIVQPVEMPAGWGAPEMLYDADYSVCSAAPMIDAKRSRQHGGAAYAPARLLPPPPDLPQAIERVAAALRALTSSGWFPTRRKRLFLLIQSLDALAALLRSQRHARQADAETLLQRCRELHAAFDGRSSSRRAALAQLAADAQAFVDELRPVSEPARAEFWK
jgi:Ca-activated chloride channel homolog